jgi:hypothetical protein
MKHKLIKVGIGVMIKKGILDTQIGLKLKRK